MKVVAVLLPSAALFITYLFGLEVIKYRTGRSPISRRRFRLRMAAWLTAVALCAAIFIGMFFISREFTLRHPLGVLLFWTGCLIAAVALIAIMYADVKEVEAGVQQREVELWRDLAHTLADKEKKRSNKQKPQEPPKV